MILPTQISFRNMKPSDKVQKWIEEHAAKLDEFHHRITGCRVMVEIPNRRMGGNRYHVRIDLTVPGTELVVKRQPGLHSSNRQMGAPKTTKRQETDAAHKELQRTIHDAFKEMSRRLQDYARRQRGEVKTHLGAGRSQPGNSTET